MIKSLPTTLLLCLVFTITFSQGQKFVFIEGGGSGVLVNVNFDMRFKKESRDGIGFKVGFGHTDPYISDVNIVTIPFGINYLHGKGSHGLLLGANATFGIIKESRDYIANNIVPSLEIGYRYKPKKGFSFQVTYTPLFNTVDGFMTFYGGIGVGYTWK